MNDNAPARLGNADTKETSGLTGMTLASAVASRICHDLVSPVGAIGNGLELLSLGGADSGPVIDMLDDACNGAVARLRLFRLAFGMSSPSQTVRLDELIRDLETVTRGTRISYTCQGPTAVARDHAQMGLLIGMCHETAMPRGGRIMLDLGPELVVTGTATDTAPGPDLWACLLPDVPAPTQPSHVHFAVLRAMLIGQDRIAHVETQSDHVTVRIARA